MDIEQKWKLFEEILSPDEEKREKAWKTLKDKVDSDWLSLAVTATEREIPNETWDFLQYALSLDEIIRLSNGTINKINAAKAKEIAESLLSKDDVKTEAALQKKENFEEIDRMLEEATPSIFTSRMTVLFATNSEHRERGELLWDKHKDELDSEDYTDVTIKGVTPEMRQEAWEKNKARMERYG